MNVGKLLILAGFGLIVLGILWMLGAKIGLGRLPGDISYHGDRVSFYFPIVTCAIISLVVTLVLWLIQWWRG
jgi:hypothetical protein